jgi:hypothetical protein
VRLRGFVGLPDPRQRETGTRTDDRADQAGATGPRGRRNRPRTAMHTPAGVRAGQVDARQTWLASLQQGRPLSGGELGRMSARVLTTISPTSSANSRSTFGSLVITVRGVASPHAAATAS